MVFYVNLEGLSDIRSVKTLMSQLNPKRLVVIGGGEPEARTLLKRLLSTNPNMTSDIFCPVDSETLNVSAATNVFKVCRESSLDWNACNRNVILSPDQIIRELAVEYEVCQG